MIMVMAKQEVGGSWASFVLNESLPQGNLCRIRSLCYYIIQVGYSQHVEKSVANIMGGSHSSKKSESV